MRTPDLLPATVGARGAAQLPSLRAVGGSIRDAADRTVCLRGTNLGGWLLQEGWMSPAGEATLPRAGWRARAFAGSAASAVLDGNAASRWTSGFPQEVGQWLEIDLLEPRTFDQITFDDGGTDEYPSRVAIRASADRQTWWAVGEATGRPGQVVVSSTYHTARYISLVISEADPTRAWTVADVALYVSDEFSTRRMLTERFGRDVAQLLIDVHHDTWIDGSDLDRVRELGMNTVRVPFDWQLLTEPDGTPKPDDLAFRRLDWVVAAAADRGLYVILDLHGAPGGAAPWHSSGRAGSNAFWHVPGYQDWAEDIWRRVAARYRGVTGVAAYDLLNEPLVTMGEPESQDQVRQKFAILDRLYRAVRQEDPSHIVMIPVFPSWEAALPPSDFGWTNVVYQTHHYQFPAQDDWGHMAGFIEAELARLAEYQAAWGVPVYAGEFWFAEFHDLYHRWLEGLAALHASWTTWSYKVRNGPQSLGPDGVRNGAGWGLFRDCPYPVPEISTDDPATIAAKWRRFGTAHFGPDEAMQDLYRLHARGGSGRPGQN